MPDEAKSASASPLLHEEQIELITYRIVRKATAYLLSILGALAIFGYLQVDQIKKNGQEEIERISRQVNESASSVSSQANVLKQSTDALAKRAGSVDSTLDASKTALAQQQISFESLMRNMPLSVWSAAFEARDEAANARRLAQLLNDTLRIITQQRQTLTQFQQTVQKDQEAAFGKLNNGLSTLDRFDNRVGRMEQRVQNSRTFILRESADYQNLYGTPIEIRVPDVTDGHRIDKVDVRRASDQRKIWSDRNWEAGAEKEITVDNHRFTLRFLFGIDLPQGPLHPTQKDLFGIEVVQWSDSGSTPPTGQPSPASSNPAQTHP